jgi:hypothetical protein
MKVRRFSQLIPVAALGVLLMGALLLPVFFSNHVGQVLQPPGAEYSDSEVTATLVKGVANDPDAGAQIGKSASGGPDLYVKNHVAFVGTLEPSHADSLCATIADMYDPDTGLALPLTGAIVMSDGKSVAICSRH